MNIKVPISILNTEKEKQHSTLYVMQQYMYSKCIYDGFLIVP